MTFLAPAIALTSAFLFGLALHLQRKGLVHQDPLSGALISVASTAVMFWGLAVFTVEWAWFFTSAALVFALVGLVFPAGGQWLQISAISKVGPALTSAIGSFTPLWAVVPAILFLGEALSFQGVFGMTLMILALLISAMAPKAFRGGWPLWALLLPLGASMPRGFVQPIVKAGYAIVASPIFATTLMATVSSLVVFSVWLVQRPDHARPLTRPGVGWFILAGLVNGAGILAIFQAIGLAGVAAVAPLGSTSPLFALALGAFVFRTEVLRPRHYVVVALTVIGAVLLVSS